MKTIYSTTQMDDFYKSLASAVVKPSGVMNFIQHLFIAERCPKGASVLDICCGRALMVPLLKRYAPDIAWYVGIDVSYTNLNEALRVIFSGDGNAPKFPYSLIQGDVTKLPILLDSRFDAVMYTCALEHMGREAGIKSLYQISQVLAENGKLYLSTPRTTNDQPRKLQYKVHVYEWGREELEEILSQFGLKVMECIGLLPPPDNLLQIAIEAKFGKTGVRWFRNMREIVPDAFLTPVIAACFPEVAKELLYVCKRGG